MESEFFDFSYSSTFWVSKGCVLGEEFPFPVSLPLEYSPVYYPSKIEYIRIDESNQKIYRYLEEEDLEFLMLDLSLEVGKNYSSYNPFGSIPTTIELVSKEYNANIWSDSLSL